MTRRFTVPRTFNMRALLSLVAAPSSFHRSLATTALSNVVTVAAAGGAGILTARSLGPAVRGEYAAILAWFGTVLIVGELGQAPATTFFVARNRLRAPDYLATSRNIVISSGVVVLAIGVAAAPMLAAGSQAVTSGYRLAFLTCLASFVGVSYTAALQATRIRRWNLVRVSQPMLFLGAVAVLYLHQRLTLMTALVALSVTIVLRTAITVLFCRNQALTGGRAGVRLAGPMTRYGLSQVAASIPTVVAARLDQLVLSIAVPPTALGHYAIAASLTTLAAPVVSAVGHVSFPRLASQALSRAGTDRLQRWAILTSAGIAVTLMLALALSASWVVPAVFGPDYRDAVPLVWLLAPGGVFLACSQVCGDLLSGQGRPIAVAKAQGAAAATTVLLLGILLPFIGVAGAAVASSAATGVAVLLMIRTIRRHEANDPAADAATAAMTEAGSIRFGERRLP